MRVSTKLIAELVALETGVPLANIIGRSRYRTHTNARQLAAWLARRSAPTRRNYPQRTYPMIASALGVLDHQSVMYACRVVEHRVALLPWWATTAPRLLRLIEMLEADDGMALIWLAGLRRQSPELLARRRLAFEVEAVRANPVWKNLGIRRGFPEQEPGNAVVTATTD